MKPTIIIENEVYEKIMYWVNKSSDEVSGLGIVQVEAGGILRVTSAILLPQKNGATHSDIEPEGVNKAMYAMRNSPGELKFWWHSHVQMGVFWSGTDMTTIREFADGGWILATVFNQKNEMRSAFYDKNTVQSPWGPQPIFYDECPTSIATVARVIPPEWEADYKVNVTDQRKSFNAWEWQRDMNGRYTGRYPQYPGNESGYGYDNFGDDYVTREEPKSNPKRPMGVSKREWKKYIKDALYNVPAVTGLSTVTPTFNLDAYGFDQEERLLLATHGLTEKDLDFLVENDFSPNEILEIMENESTIDDITDLLGMGWTTEQIVKGLTGDEPQGVDAIIERNSAK